MAEQAQVRILSGAGGPGSVAVAQQNPIEVRFLDYKWANYILVHNIRLIHKTIVVSTVWDHPETL